MNGAMNRGSLRRRYCARLFVPGGNSSSGRGRMYADGYALQLRFCNAICEDFEVPNERLLVHLLLECGLGSRVEIPYLLFRSFVIACCFSVFRCSKWCALQSVVRLSNISLPPRCTGMMGVTWISDVLDVSVQFSALQRPSCLESTQ